MTTINEDNEDAVNDLSMDALTLAGPEVSLVAEGDDDNIYYNDPESDKNPNDNKGRSATKGRSWFPRNYKRLVKLLDDAKGAASQPVVKFIKSYLGGTKLIFVMGQTGTGKTTMLRELTGLDLKVGNTINSGTRQYQVCPAIIDEEQYLFVDTAGFGAHDMDDSANFLDILSCLEALGPFVTIAGVIFVYGKPGRMTQPDKRTVQWIQCFCGPEFYRNITIVMSQWDEYSKSGFKSAWNMLESLLGDEDISQILSPPDRYHGGSVYHHGFPGGKGSIDAYSSILEMEENSFQRGEELRNLIKTRYGKCAPAKLQILRELEAGIPADKTEAAKALIADVIHTKIRILDGEAVVFVEDDSQGALVSVKRMSAQPILCTEKGEAQAQPKQEKSWLTRLMEWFGLAKEASDYFKEARAMGHESTNREDSAPGPQWSPWNAIKRVLGIFL